MRYATRIGLVILLGLGGTVVPWVRVPAHAGRAGAARTYTNPVWNHDFPDPFLLEYGGRFYAYATQTNGYGYQVMESPDMVRWTHRGTAYIPPWSREHLWAPEVVHYRGRFYLIHSARNPQSGRHDIGIATSESPLGPFMYGAILVRADEKVGGCIDADIFFDRDGTPYLTYSEEHPRRIVVRRMAPDLMSVDSEVTELVRPDRPWERGVTEAPTLILRNGVYHLFFSVGWYQSNKKDACYAVCHASSRSVRGPFVKDPDPILATVPEKVYGPGHQCVIRLPSGEWWMGYHGWDNQNEPMYGSNPIGRSLRIDRMEWHRDSPRVLGPTTTPQPAPNLRGLRMNPIRTEQRSHAHAGR